MIIDDRLAIKRLRSGDVIHCGHVDGVERWWFETPYAEVEDGFHRRMRKQLGRRYAVVPLGSGLFDTTQAQTWTAQRVSR